MRSLRLRAVLDVGILSPSEKCAQGDSNGEAILADHVYDERFCERVARRREEFVLSVSDWTNLMLNPPPHVLEFIGAMASDKALCDEFTTNFNHPDRQVDERWREGDGGDGRPLSGKLEAYIASKILRDLGINAVQQ